MNRAKCITIVLQALVSAFALVTLTSAAVAQSQRPKGVRAQGAALQRRQGRAVGGPQHPFYPPNMSKLPAGITLRTWAGPSKGHRAPGDQNVIRQTILLTKSDPNAQFSTTPAQSVNQHPFWTADEKLVFFDSNRNGPTDSTSTNNGPFNIYQMYPDGSGVVQTLPDPANHQIEPAVSADNSSLAFVSGGTINTDGTTKGFNLYTLSLNNPTTAIPLTNLSGATINFDDVRHPTWSPDNTVIAFAGRAKGDTLYHIFTVSLTLGDQITQLTGGASNDYAPAWSPYANNSQSINSSLIAFTTNATGFAPGGPNTAASVKSSDDIFAMSPSPFLGTIPVRITNFSVGGVFANNRNPAWSTRRLDPQGQIPVETDSGGNALNPHESEQLLAFASNRIDTNNDGVANGIGGVGGLPNTSDIYWLYTRIIPDPNHPTQFTIGTTETPPTATTAGNVAHKLQTSDPTAGLDPTEPTYNFDGAHASNEDYPAWPQYQNSYRMVFQSNRGNQLEVWGASIIDLNAPSLLKYDVGNNEIVHVALDANPEISTREVAAGQAVRFRVRAEDYESGVESAFLQIKCPDSLALSTDGAEHKIFVPEARDISGSPMTPTFVINTPVEDDAQAVDANTQKSNTFPHFRPTGYGSSSGIGILTGWPGGNPFTPTLQDDAAFSGSVLTNRPDVPLWVSPLAPPGTPPTQPADPNNNGFWLQLYDDGPMSKGGHEPEGETAGDGVWTAVWTTPASMPSDWILDVILRDKAIDPFTPEDQTNWKIYDNVWGFTSRPFSANNKVLYVSDYDTGQKFLGSTPKQGTGFFPTFAGTPTESWMTEFDPLLFPSLEASGTGMPKAILNFQTTLGLHSYGDPGNGFAADSSDADDTGKAPQYYDVWRIQCRGPIPTAVLNRYLPVKVQQPFDPISQTTPPPALVAERCVIWHSPYSGDLFVGPGTILDASVQNQLKTFVASGGRLLMTGQDIAWALTLGGTVPANDFLNNTLHVQFAYDSVYNGNPSTVNPADRSQLNMTATDPNNQGRGGLPIGWETWFQLAGPLYHNYPGTTPPPDFPPASGSLYIDTTTSQARTFGAANQGAPDVVTFIDDGATKTFKPIGGATPYYDDVDARYNAAPLAAPAIMWYTDNAANSKIVFSPCGWEAINSEQGTAGMTTIFLNRRTELMHNALDYMRTGRIVGLVRVVNPTGGASSPLGGAHVRAVDEFGTIYTATTQNDGSYTILGLYPSGVYQMDASKAGFVVQHATSNVFHGAAQATNDFFMTQAQPGGISGNNDVITDASNGKPVAGAIVEAMDSTTPGDPNSPKFFSSPSDSTGHYAINNLPASTYTLSISNLGQPPIDNYVSIASPPPPGTYTGVLVSSGSAVDNKSFALNPKPGSIVGVVHIANADGTDSGTPLPGATVTATAGMTTFATTTPTGADGTFTLPNVAPGVYGVVATTPGYAPTTPSVSVTVVTNQASTGVVLLEKQIPPGSISGLVATSSGIPVSGATVTETDPAGGTITVTTGAVQTKTDPVNGGNYTYNYSFPTVPAGTTVQVTATKGGYTPKPNPDTQSVTITAGTESAHINFVLDPLFVFDNDLALVSMPYIFSTDSTPTGPLIDPTTLFGVPSSDVSSNAFAFITWDAVAKHYIYRPTSPADGFHLGVGYFMQDTNTASTLSLTNPNGIVAPQAAGAYLPFLIQLQPGWNMIGGPFTTPVDFSKLQISLPATTVYPPTQGQQLIDVPQAQSTTNPTGAALLGAALWTYEHGAYQVLYSLDPYRGYWLLNLSTQPVTLIVTATAQQTRGVFGGKGRALEYTNSNSGDWKLQIVASASGLTTAQAMLGAQRSAADGYDLYKMKAPPVLHDGDTTITFDHNDWGNNSGRYAVDVRSTSNASWDFVVRSGQPNQALTLTWPNLSKIGHRDVTLTDLDTQASFNLRNRSAYSIPSTNGPMTHHFRLTVQRAVRSKLQILNIVTRQPSRAAGSTASVDYTLTSDAQVEVSILKGGRLVRRLGSGSRAAGASTVVWDLRDDHGTTLPSSVYLVEVRAIDRDGRMVRRQSPLVITH